MATPERVFVFKTFDQETALLGSTSSKLENLLDKLSYTTAMSCSSQSTHVVLTATGKDEKIDATILGEDKRRLPNLELRFRQELAMVYFILHETWMTSTIDKRIESQTQWYSEYKLPSNLMELKRRIVWLTYELNRCHLRILDLAHQSDKTSYVEPGGQVQIATTPLNKSAPVRFNPLLRPLPGDCKPNIPFETFTLIREFIFIKKDVDPALRFQLVERLEGYQLGQLLSGPHEFFADIVRCLGMSAQEFLNACFKYDKDGKLTGTTRCPCGTQLDVCYDGIHDHVHCCEFREFVDQQCPSVLQDSLYSFSHEFRVMGWKETAYIVDVIKKRLPRDEWKKTVLGEHA